jgi:hypothetical protein
MFAHISLGPEMVHGREFRSFPERQWLVAKEEENISHLRCGLIAS